MTYQPLDHLLLFAAAAVWIKPLWAVGLGMLVAAAMLAGVVSLLRWATPRVAAIAWTTGKEAISQPLFYLLLSIGAFLLLLLPFIPYFTFGEDVKVVKETGLTFIMLLSIGFTLWTASVAIAQELEGRTALTVLSKPISRREFVLGKFLGVLGPVIVMFIVLGGLFLCTVSYKVVYDARESVLPEPTAQQCLDEIVQIAPGLALAFMEAVVLTSISVAISTRVPMLPNLMICFSIYVLGHLVPMLASSTVGQSYPIVLFMADLLSTILPVLDNFNIYGAISTGRPVPGEYLLWSAVYCLLFSTVMMLLALLLFEDRDLA
jgi:ABC-type transport system involved in multi-copper enzyme maturation permease subunit